MAQHVELKVVMDNVPIGANPQGIADEIAAMLKREYADGVQTNVSVVQQDKPKAGDKLQKKDKE